MSNFVIVVIAVAIFVIGCFVASYFSQSYIDEKNIVTTRKMLEEHYGIVFGDWYTMTTPSKRVAYLVPLEVTSLGVRCFMCGDGIESNTYNIDAGLLFGAVKSNVCFNNEIMTTNEND